MIRTIVIKVQDNNPPMKWTKRYADCQVSLVKISVPRAELIFYTEIAHRELLRETQSRLWDFYRHGLTNE